MAKKSISNPLDILSPKDEVPEETKPLEPIVEDVNMTARLEEAANLLLSQFVPSVRDFACEVSDLVLKVPRWQLVCGSLLAQYESGSLPSPSLDPAWTHGEIAETKRVCEWCHEEFMPKRFRQRFCSNMCGANAAKDKAHVDVSIRA